MTAQPDAIALPATPRSVRRYARLKLLGLFLVCAAPMVAAYLAYYVFPPNARSHFGALIEPQRPVPADVVVTPVPEPSPFSTLRGKWVLLQVDGGACAAECANKLYALRQQRTMTGKHRERIERVWLVSDDHVPDPRWQADYAGTLLWRANPEVLSQWLPTEPGRTVQDYLYVVDPMGHLMMRFDAQGDPAKIRRDLSRLLRASQIG